MPSREIQLQAKIKKLEAQLKKSNVKSVTTSTETRVAVLGCAIECLPEAVSNPDGFRPASMKFGRDSIKGGMFLISVWKYGKPQNVSVRVNDIDTLIANVKKVKHVPYIKE